MYEPLKIRAYLQTGIISDQFLPLDAIIYYHTVREKYGEQYECRPLESSMPQYGKVTLPFARKLSGNPFWFYSCSFAQWPDDTAVDMQSFSKRFDLKYSDLIDFGKLTAKITTSRGRYKGYFIKVYYRHALYVDWYAYGNKSEIEFILKFVTHLGKKTSQGWGAVKAWNVESFHSDWSVRGFDDNRLMRAVPVKENGLLWGIRPSYWLPEHQFLCKLPGG